MTVRIIGSEEETEFCQVMIECRWYLPVEVNTEQEAADVALNWLNDNTGVCFDDIECEDVQVSGDGTIYAHCIAHLSKVQQEEVTLTSLGVA